MTLHPRRWSLATKWSLMLTVLALAPLLVAISVSHSASAEKIVEKTVLGLAHSAADGAAHLDAAVDERVRQTVYVSGLPSVQRYVTSPIGQRQAHLPAVQSDLLAVVSAYPYLESLDLLDAQGVVIYSTSGHKGVYRDSDLLQTVSTGKIFVAGLQPSGQDRSSLVIAAPIGKGASGGVLRLQSSPEFMTTRVARDGQRAGGTGLLLDEKGRSIARSDSGPAGEAVALGDGRLTLYNGTAYFAHGAKLESIPWTYVVALPEAQLADELAQQRNQSLLLAFGVALIIGGLARVLALGLARPLTQMAVVTRALAAGDLTISVPASSKQDELGQLQNAFDEAYKQLRRLVARMRLSSHLVAEASQHLHTQTAAGGQSGSVGASAEKLAVVARDLEKQVAHFKI